MSEDKMTTLIGHRGFDAVKADGSTERVQIRQLPVKLYPALIAVIGDELRQVELYCDKPQGWADDLPPSVHSEIMTIAEEINSGFFAWVERQTRRQKALMPIAWQKLQENVAELSSPTTSPKSPSNAGLRSTKPVDTA